MLSFSGHEINGTGLRLELKTGTLGKLYVTLIDVLTEFYNQEGITFIHPEDLGERVVDSLGRGTKGNLDGHRIERQEEGRTLRSLGHINLSYLITMSKSTSLAGVDYAASRAYSEDYGPEFDALSLFFNTYRESCSKVDNPARRQQERDTFKHFMCRY